MRYILITGARDYPDLQKAIYVTMDAFCKCGTILVHGNARGIDQEVAKAFDTHINLNPLYKTPDFRSMPFHAEWSKYGKRAGVLRNQEMVDFVLQRAREEHEVTCLAFPLEPRREHSGTWDCIDRIKKSGLELWIFPEQSQSGVD